MGRAAAVLRRRSRARRHQRLRPATTRTRRHGQAIVIGSGIAGLTYAIKVAQYGSVAVITKDYAKEGCTQYAQGGVCAVLDATDSVQDHVCDTIVAGAFLNDNKCVVTAGDGGTGAVVQAEQPALYLQQFAEEITLYTQLLAIN